MSAADKAFFLQLLISCRRNHSAAVRAARRAWKAGAVITATPISPRTGFPRGWTAKNLARQIQIPMRRGRVDETALPTIRVAA